MRGQPAAGAPDTSLACRAGDRLLFGLVLEFQDRRQDRFIEIEALPDSAPAQTGRVRVLSTVYDNTATVRNRAVSFVRESDLARALAGFASPAAPTGGFPTDAAGTDSLGRVLEDGLAALGRILHANAALDSLRGVITRQVIAPSSPLMGAVRAILGLSPGHIRVRGEEVAFESDPHPWTGLPSLRIPAAITRDGRTTVRIDLEVVAPDPPFLLTGGVVGIEGTNMEQPDRRFAIDLLAAHRGSGPPVGRP